MILRKKKLEIPNCGTLAFNFALSLIIFQQVVGHEYESHVNSHLTLPSQMTSLITQTNLYLPKDRFHINLTFSEKFVYPWKIKVPDIL